MPDVKPGLSAAEIKDAYRLHEALLIKLAPTHLEPCPVADGEGHCTCAVFGTALFAAMITRHAPTARTDVAPCPAHEEFPVMLSVPGFRCEECVVAMGLDCCGCGEEWPCADVRVAQNACELDAPGAVDEFLESLSAPETETETEPEPETEVAS
jgi:hypothetical protein